MEGRVKMGELIYDGSINPRGSYMSIEEAVNNSRVNLMVASLERGDSLPAVVVDENTRILVEGCHRYMAYRRLCEKNGVNWQKFEIPATKIAFRDKKDMIYAAVRYNSTHGANLNEKEREYSRKLLARYFSPDVIRRALNEPYKDFLARRSEHIERSKKIKMVSDTILANAKRESVRAPVVRRPEATATKDKGTPWWRYAAIKLVTWLQCAGSLNSSDRKQLVVLRDTINRVLERGS